MVTSDKIINAPISIQDVRKTLLVSSLDLGKLATSNKINKWSKHKPVSYPSVSAIIEDIWNGANACGGMKVDVYKSLFGDISKIHYNSLYVDISQDTTGFLYKLAKGQLTDWEYDLPKGGSNSPYRLGDFDGYNHKAIKPLPTKPKGHYQKYFDDVEGLEYVNISFSVPPQPQLPVGNMLPSEMEIPGVTNLIGLRDWYVGVLLYNDDLTETIFFTSFYKGPESDAVLYKTDYSSIDLILNKKFKCRAFLSKDNIFVNSPSDLVRTVIPCGSTEDFIRIYDSNKDFLLTLIYFNIKWLDASKTKLDVTVDYVIYPDPNKEDSDGGYYLPYWITNIRIEMLSSPTQTVKKFPDWYIINDDNGIEKSFSASYSGLEHVTFITFYYTLYGKEFSERYENF